MLDDVPLGDLERLDVGWPVEQLADLTLIDTPGLGSVDEAASERTREALLDDGADGPGQADAVIYLMRHLHRHDCSSSRRSSTARSPMPRPSTRSS